MGAYANDPAMFKWLDSVDKGAGAVKKRKDRYAPVGRETAKSKRWEVLKMLDRGAKVHYGEERNKKIDKIATWNVEGHVVSLYANGNLTCNCNGWIFKREGVPRECIHVREKCGELLGKKTPDKKPVNHQAKQKKEELFECFFTNIMLNILR